MEEQPLINTHYKPWLRRKKNLVYQNIILTLLFLLILSLVGSIVYLIIIFNPIIYSFHQLISSKIPLEIDYYHQIIDYQNKSISFIEQKIDDSISIQDIKDIIYSIKKITSQTNITQIQDNLNDIANILNQIIHH